MNISEETKKEIANLRSRLDALEGKIEQRNKATADACNTLRYFIDKLESGEYSFVSVEVQTPIKNAPLEYNNLPPKKRVLTLTVIKND